MLDGKAYITQSLFIEYLKPPYLDVASPGYLQG